MENDPWRETPLMSLHFHHNDKEVPVGHDQKFIPCC